MKLQNIKVSDAKRSETNPRIDADFAGPEFDDLVSSVKEKGILTPILVRLLTGKNKVGKYEVIAGNRRLAAAKSAGLDEIPAQVVEMTDTEAREAQIVENLQRKDIHPLDEGESYRQLIESAKYTIDDVAAKVGKSESYVRQRLFLTNLESKPAKAYREGKLNDGIAVLIARLSPGDQSRTIAEVESERFNVSTSQVKEWIESNIYSPLDHQPWVGNAAFEKVVGPCTSCPPNNATLFGPAKEGRCTDIKCWQKKMSAYIVHRQKEGKLTLVSTEWGSVPKGVLSKSQYTLIAKKGKDRCESTHGAIVTQGADVGTEFDICSNNNCETHHPHRAEYRQTPEEKQKRKKELERERAASEKKYLALVAEIKKKAKWPMTEKVLDFMIEDALHDHGVTSLQKLAKRIGVKMQKEKNTWGDTNNGYKTGIREHIAKASPAEKLQLYVELRISKGYDPEKKLKSL